MHAEGPGKDASSGELLERRLTESIIACFYTVYNYFGYGLFEKAYVESLAEELVMAGHQVRREVPTRIVYKGRVVAVYKTDLVVNDKVVIEVKSTSRLNREDPRQLLNFLRASHWEVGLLFHFGPQPCFYRMVSSNSDRMKRGGSQKGS